MSTPTPARVRQRLAVTAAAAAAMALLAGTSPAAAQAAAVQAVSGNTWGTAEEVPGTAALNTGGSAAVDSVSCASAGNCSAGGYYFDGSGNQLAFVVSQVHGTWGTAEEVPGTATLSHGYAAILSVSCASESNCSAAGGYNDSAGGFQVFVVSEVGGTWGTAEEVPGTATLNTGGNDAINSVSCASAGNCSAGGYYVTSSGQGQAMVVSEVDGTWGKAKGVPGTVEMDWVSCASAGNCSAGGYYTDSSGHTQAFVVSQVHGTWGTAEEVPGTATLNKGFMAAITSMSCASAANCSAGGIYTDSSGHTQAFVVSQVHSTWGKAKEAPGTATLNHGNASLGSPGISSGMSCASAGNCSAGGTYTDSSGHTQVFVVSQVGGTWGTAKEVPGTATLNKGGNAMINSVSCASAANCSTGGSYKDGSGHTQAFVVSQVHGTWGTAKEVPGTATLNKGGNATINSVSCASAGHCSAGGSYKDGSGHGQAFVVSQT